MACVRAGEAKLRGSVRAAMVPPKVEAAGTIFAVDGAGAGAAAARLVPGGFQVVPGRWFPLR